MERDFFLSFTINSPNFHWHKKTRLSVWAIFAVSHHVEKTGKNMEVCFNMHAQWSLTLWDPMDCSPPVFSLHGILQTRIPEWVAISFPRGIFLPQGSNPSLLHWQAGSLPLSRRPWFYLLSIKWKKKPKKMAYIERPLQWMNSVISGKGVEFENPLFCSPSSWRGVLEAWVSYGDVSPGTEGKSQEKKVHSPRDMILYFSLLRASVRVTRSEKSRLINTITVMTT